MNKLNSDIEIVSLVITIYFQSQLSRHINYVY